MSPVTDLTAQEAYDERSTAPVKAGKSINDRIVFDSEVIGDSITEGAQIENLSVNRAAKQDLTWINQSSKSDLGTQPTRDGPIILEELPTSTKPIRISDESSPVVIVSPSSKIPKPRRKPEPPSINVDQELAFPDPSEFPMRQSLSPGLH